MEPGSKWKAAALLTWLLAAETAHSLPKPAGTLVESILQNTEPGPTTAFKTQYPPTNERLLVPQTHPVYRTALENDGHPSQLPFPTLDAGRLVHDIYGLLTGPTLAPPNPTLPQQTLPQPTLSPPPHPEPTQPDEQASSVPSSTTTVESPSAVIKNSTSETATEPATTSIKGSFPTDTMADQDIFQPVATGMVSSNITVRHDHPVSNQHVKSTNPIETNKFYAGLFLGTQSNASFTQPYSLAWSKGTGTLKSWGMAVAHIESRLLAYGPKQQEIPGNPVRYYINPTGLQHLILSADELGESSKLTVENPKGFSAQAVLSRSSGSAQKIVFPVVQGMGYVTGIYTNLQPVIESGVFFRNVVSAGSPRQGIYKYRVALEDESSWLVYVASADGQDPNLKLVSNSKLQGPSGFSGTIQVAKNPAGTSGEKFYDNSAGVYPVEGNVSGAVSGAVGTYSLSWTKAGKDAQGTPLIMFALPHHVQSFNASTKGRVTDIHLRSTTKGNMTAVIGETWTMAEPGLPIEMGFAPWSPSLGTVQQISAAAQQFILQVAPVELKQNMDSQTNLNSMYYSGKALSKFATLVYTVNQLGNDVELAAAGLQELKKCFARFVNNQQQYPLVYDAVWKGVVSSAGYNGDLLADFGNTAYNDHHFHYGYFIQAAAIIGALDPSWLAANKDWVNMLMRDASNPVDDGYFPFSRAFDWFNGHSWAKGLFESYDGKDEESTSEDSMFSYAVKMWGHTIGDASMEARGNMMLGIMRRTLHEYFLMENNNTNQPPNFIANKVTGILFENKVDHTTYFGDNLAYIQGIHMLPLLPSSAYMRRQQFVAQEWAAMFAANASTPASQVDGGWKGVLYANLALIDPKSSWNFFAQPQFDYSWIDGGASRTWYLAFAAALGGAP